MDIKKILFIVNPVLEKKSEKNISSLVSEYLDDKKFSYRIVFSEYQGHATELSSAGRNDYDLIVAGGGDGMVNEVAKGLSGSDTVMGVIPLGSGNGFARAMGIPLNIVGAIRTINRQKIKIIDMGLANNEPFFNIAGIGFDAKVAHFYAGKEERGFFSYLQAVLENIFVYKSSEYSVIMKSEQMQVKSFLISFANSSQWGYNAHVCPCADPSDGFLGVTIIHDFPKMALPGLFFRLFTKKLHKSPYVDIFKVDLIEVKFSGEIMGHIDGNPVTFSNSIRVQVVPQSLKIITE
jgi:YegS/Rv2252/BmrU family lipid kinase